MTETPLIRFKAICLDENPLPDSSDLQKLIGYCEIFETKGFARSYEEMTPEYRRQFGYPDKGSEGNLSYLDGNVFVITGSSIPTKKGMSREQFARVVSVTFEGNECSISYEGAWKPSSESMMHDAMYKSSNSLRAIFHGHDDPLIARMEEQGIFPEIDGVAYTKSKPKAGTRETPDTVLDVLDFTTEFIVIRGHGFVSLGESMEQAMERYETNMTKLRKIFSE